MNNMLLITGLTAAIIAGGASQSQAESGDMMHHGFDEVDTNGDGQLSKAEMQEHRKARFARADTDGSGTLSVDEMVARVAEHMTKRFSKMIKRHDSDGDGEMSMDEMAARHKGDMFSMMDTDGDGAVSADEFEAMKDMRGKHRGGDHKHQGQGATE